VKLYPRNPGPNKAEHAKERAASHRILDRYLKGKDMRPVVIDWALRETGDLTPEIEAMLNQEAA
jgi:hypothetical protein